MGLQFTAFLHINSLSFSVFFVFLRCYKMLAAVNLKQMMERNETHMRTGDFTFEGESEFYPKM